MVKEIGNEKKRAAKSLAGATSKHEKSDKPERSETFLKACKSVVKRAHQRLKDMQQAATMFGINVGELPVESTASAIEKMGLEMRAKALCYASMTDACQDEGLKTAAEQDLVPAGILADSLEDHGGDPTDARNLFDS